MFVVANAESCLLFSRLVLIKHCKKNRFRFHVLLHTFRRTRFSLTRENTALITEVSKKDTTPENQKFHPNYTGINYRKRTERTERLLFCINIPSKFIYFSKIEMRFTVQISCLGVVLPFLLCFLLLGFLQLSGFRLLN